MRARMSVEFVDNLGQAFRHLLLVVVHHAVTRRGQHNFLKGIIAATKKAALRWFAAIKENNSFGRRGLNSLLSWLPFIAQSRHTAIVY